MSAGDAAHVIMLAMAVCATMYAIVIYWHGSGR